MKRYWVFGGQIYYASGGFKDFLRDFDDRNAAIDFAADQLACRTNDVEWTQIVDTDLGKIIRSVAEAY